MKNAALIPVEEYLRTTYRPDRDYVDGEVFERNLGELDHSDLQSEFVYYFRIHRRKWKTYAFVEQRVQVSNTRFRIPDVCVVVGEKPNQPILRTPPFICIEVLSPKDRTERAQERIDDYLKFGVRYVWVINPENRRVWVYTQAGCIEVTDGILRTEDPSLTILLAEISAVWTSRLMVMKAAALIPVEEYLRTTYRPDRDYVDGEVLERNLGELDHSDLQTEIAYYFRVRRRQWKTYAFVEQRVQVSKTRFRIPDVCVVVGEKPNEPILRTPPFICIEVLSPKDRTARVQERIDDYLKFGVRYVWVINPENRRVWVYTQAGRIEVTDGILRTEDPSLTILLGEIFAGLDE